ncbi:MAG: T9SS type A sorting domain-containing protein [Flavobacteriales bacterium]
MTKIYSTVLGLLIAGGGVMAQSKTQLPLEYRVKPTLDRVTSSSSAERGDAIWCDDFSDANTWELGTLDGTTNNWVIGTAVPDGDFPIAAITSTTAANGYALFDSDLFCTTDNGYVQMATPVDLQGISNVVVVFEQYYRQFQGACFMDVSTDGSTWNEILVNGEPATGAINEINVNAATSNPQTVEVNISAIAGNQSSVWIRFRYVGACDYAWMVDDVCIIEQAPVDLVMLDGFLTHTGTGEEYGRIPQDQLNPTMLAGGSFVNNGSSTLTNVVVTMTLRNSSNAVVATASTTEASLASGAISALEAEINTADFNSEDVYTATFTATCDQIADDVNPGNNEYLRAFEVTNARYSGDGIGNHPAGYEVLNSLGTNSFTGAEDGLQVMTYYEVIDPIDVYGIEVELAFGTAIGGFAIGNILDTTDVFAATTNVNNPLVESPAFDVVQDDLDNGVLRLMFDNVYNLPAGGYYGNVVLNSNAGAGHIRVLDDQTVPQPDIMSLIYIPGDDLYINGIASAVRLITQPLNVSVSEASDLEGVSLFPNPTNGVLNIRTRDLEVYNVEVFGVAGELVRSERINGTSTMDISELAKGVYTVRIFNNNGTLTQRVTLQ